MALKQLTVDILATGLQVSPENPIEGLDGRASLLIRLGSALDNQQFFGVDSRPGNMLGTHILVSLKSTALTRSRLPTTTPFNPEVGRDPCYHDSYVVVGSHGWSGSYLAAGAHTV